MPSAPEHLVHLHTAVRNDDTTVLTSQTSWNRPGLLTNLMRSFRTYKKPSVSAGIEPVSSEL